MLFLENYQRKIKGIFADVPSTLCYFYLLFLCWESSGEKSTGRVPVKTDQSGRNAALGPELQQQLLRQTWRRCWFSAEKLHNGESFLGGRQREREREQRARNYQEPRNVQTLASPTFQPSFEMSLRSCRCLDSAAAAVALVCLTVLLSRSCLCNSEEEDEVLGKNQLAEFYSKLLSIIQLQTACLSVIVP